MTNEEYQELTKATAELATEDAQNKPAYPHALTECRSVYRRLNSQDRNRLTASAFFGGLAFAAFAAVAATPDTSSTHIGITEFPPAHNHWLPMITALLLAVATLFFLGAAMTAYEVIRSLSNLPPDAVKSLTDKSEEDLGPVSKLRLREAYRMHRQASGWITNGIQALAAALLCFALQINAYVAGLLVVAWIGALIRLRVLTAKMFGRQTEEVKAIEALRTRAKASNLLGPQETP